MLTLCILELLCSNRCMSWRQIHKMKFKWYIYKAALNNWHTRQGTSWPWSYGSWIYNYLCNQCLSPLMLWVRISVRARCTTLYDKVCQWLATGRWFSPGPPVSSTNKTDRHDITEILLKVALSTIKQTIFILWIIKKKIVSANFIHHWIVMFQPSYACRENKYTKWN